MNWYLRKRYFFVNMYLCEQVFVRAGICVSGYFRERVFVPLTLETVKASQKLGKMLLSPKQA